MWRGVISLRFSRVSGRTCAAAMLAVFMAGLGAAGDAVPTAGSYSPSDASRAPSAAATGDKIAGLVPLPVRAVSPPRRPGAEPASPRRSPTPPAEALPSPCYGSDSAMETSPLDGGLDTMQANEYNSTAPFSICSNGTSQFRVTTSGIDVATDGKPGAYPSLYKGCHWGTCTPDSGLPIEVSTMERRGTVTTSYATQTVSKGAWDDAYDIFYAPGPAGTQSSGSSIEMMVWLMHNGPVEPAGSVAADDVSIGGNAYNIWWDGYTVTYALARPAQSLSRLDLGPLAADAVARGYLPASWYLIDVEAGFEIWQGGAGLTASSFSVRTPGGKLCIHGVGPVAPTRDGPALIRPDPRPEPFAHGSGRRPPTLLRTRSARILSWQIAQ